MTEAEWLATNSPADVFQQRSCGSSLRKTRLLLCAYCRHTWTRITDPHRDAAIDVAERYADGGADEGELWPMLDAVRAGADTRYREEQPHNDYDYLVELAVDGSASMSDVIARFGVVVRGDQSFHRRLSRSQQAEQRVQASLIRDIFGNPFRQVVFSPAWRTGTAVLLARQMYESRDFSAMPILADALQDAGCEAEQLLEHCRGLGPHVRGCWAVDLVLGKE